MYEPKDPTMYWSGLLNIQSANVIGCIRFWWRSRRTSFERFPRELGNAVSAFFPAHKRTLSKRQVQNTNKKKERDQYSTRVAVIENYYTSLQSQHMKMNQKVNKVKSRNYNRCLNTQKLPVYEFNSQESDIKPCYIKNITVVLACTQFSQIWWGAE